MKKRIPSSGLFLLAWMLVAAVNGAVLSGVAYNRSGPPEARIVLSERELPLAYRRHEENSGLALRLAWRTIGEDDERYVRRSSPAWLTPAKLQALGFDLPQIQETDKKGAAGRAPLPKEVFVVLEFDGPAYREALARTAEDLHQARNLHRAHPENEKLREAYQAAETRLKRERLSASRLFVVDAGHDAARLRTLFPDRTRYIIARGLVRAGYHRADRGWRPVGTIGRLLVESIHVALPYRKPLETLTGGDRYRKTAHAPPRYQVELIYGRRFEPWIAAVMGMGGKGG